MKPNHYNIYIYISYLSKTPKGLRYIISGLKDLLIIRRITTLTPYRTSFFSKPEQGRKVTVLP